MEKITYGENSFNFSISKIADTPEQAMKFKVLLEELNDRKDKTFFIASDSETIMNRVITQHNESVSNGTYYKKHNLKNSDDKDEFTI